MDLYKERPKMIYWVIAYVIASFTATGTIAWLLKSGRIGFVPNEED